MTLRFKVFGGAAVGALAIALATPSSAATFFKIDPTPGGTALKLSNAKDTSSDTGAVGVRAVAIAVNDTANFASGDATIKPDMGALDTLTFTPKDGLAFNDFSFRGQDLVAGQTIDVTVQDDQGDAPETFVFTEGKANADFARIGVTADTAGKTIKWVEISNNGGFKQSKQFDFSFAPAIPVPEPAAWAMMLGGLALVGAGLRLSRRGEDKAQAHQAG